MGIWETPSKINDFFNELLKVLIKGRKNVLIFLIDEYNIIRKKNVMNGTNKF